ncbi:hypothetical protein AGMMS49983_10080 [Clostridia bacterium]|nr:hypothetical protein AGMMS49983_10080 [Clostridia bacterium]
MTSNLFRYSYQVGGKTDIGRKRSSNQDAVASCPELSFFAVIDGMGGLPASMPVVEALAETLPQRLREAVAATGPDSLSAEIAAGILKNTVENVSDELFCRFNSDGWGIFGGATLVCVWLVADHAVFAGLGDCRGYVLRGEGKAICQITEDHNEAAALVRNGTITKREAMRHRGATKLDRFVGMPQPADADCFVEAMRPGDSILLCSDGLHGQVYEQEITTILQSGDSPADVCAKLIDAANDAGGSDNVAALCIQIEASRREEME